MTKLDHVFHSLEAKGIEIHFYPDRIIALNIKLSMQDECSFKDFNGAEAVAKFLAHKYEVKFHEIRS